MKKNPFNSFIPSFERQRKVNWRATFFFTMLVVLGLYAMSQAVYGEAPQSPVTIIKPVKAETPTLAPKTATASNYSPTEPVKGVFVPKNSYQMKVTGFSSTECGTSYCRANAGKPRGQKVALNKKFGKAKRVYIPAFDKYYDVIGTTDYKTDLDIWFGDEYESAKEFGNKTLLVNIIK